MTGPMKEVETKIMANDKEVTRVITLANQYYLISSLSGKLSQLALKSCEERNPEEELRIWKREIQKLASVLKLLDSFPTESSFEKEIVRKLSSEYEIVRKALYEPKLESDEYYFRAYSSFLVQAGTLVRGWELILYRQIQDMVPAERYMAPIRLLEQAKDLHVE